MRIRSIKPEFWRSDDIAALDIETRLLFIGLWSYVDDNGVGRDQEALIAADLFAIDLSRDPRETLARIHRGLLSLSAASLITRYEVDGRYYLYVTTWSTHQRIDRPNKARYPLPEAGNPLPDNGSRHPREGLARMSRGSREDSLPGAGEQGNRGTDISCPSADAEGERDPAPPDLFDEWWALWPRKVAKGDAAKAWKGARRKADQQVILDGLRAHLPSLAAADPQYVPYPATWLRGERWADEPPQAPAEDWRTREARLGWGDIA